MVSHFFDIDNFIKLNQMVWIIDKSRPNLPLLKLTRSDYNIIKKGLFLNTGFKLKIENEYFYFSENMFNEIKLACKRNSSNISNLSFSLKEFEDRENKNYTLNLDPIKHLFGTKEIVYIVCSKFKTDFYEKVIEDLDEKLRERGIKPRDYYFIIENPTDVLDSDQVIYKKLKLFLQHLVGYRTEKDKFIDLKITDIDDVYYYGDNRTDISKMDIFNNLFRSLLYNTDEYLKDIIVNIIKSRKKTLTTNLVTSNKMNMFQTNSYDLSYNERLKRFKDF